MSRYRKIEVCIWADDKFRALSPLPPSGQSLWLFLLTGLHTGPVPGLFRAGQMAMAEELGWEPEAFQEAFGEVFREGLAKADWKARVVWIPKAINHNLPQSPNVIKSWEEELKLIPECSLKTEALQGIRVALEPLGSSYLSVFDSISQVKPSRKPFAKPSAKAMPNQEQHQQQEQEQQENISAQAPDTQTASPVCPPMIEPESESEPEPLATATPPSAIVPNGFEAFWREYPQRAGGNPKSAAVKSWNAQRKQGHSADEIITGTQRYAAFCTATNKIGSEYVKQASTFLNQQGFLDAWTPPTPKATAIPGGGRRPNTPHEAPRSTDPRVAEVEAILAGLNQPVIEGECHVVH